MDVFMAFSCIVVGFYIGMLLGDSKLGRAIQESWKKREKNKSKK